MTILIDQLQFVIISTNVLNQKDIILKLKDNYRRKLQLQTKFLQLSHQKMNQKQKLQKQAQAAYHIFILLIQQKKLPPKVALKLQYLSESFIKKKLHTPLQQKNEQLFQQQKKSLDQIPVDIKLKMFIQIVESLENSLMKRKKLLKQQKVKVVRQNQLAYIRKDNKQSQWVKCLITLSNKSLVLINNKTQQVLKEFKVDEIVVGGQSQKMKKKYQLSIQYRESVILVGFDYEEMAEKVLREIKNIKKEMEQQKKQKENMLKKIKKQIISKNKQKNSKLQEQKTRNKKLLNTKLGQVTKFIEKYKNDYKLVQTTQNYRILQNTINQKSKCKITFLLENITPEIIVQSFLRFNQWNQNIELVSIVEKQQNTKEPLLNLIKIKLKYKKKSFFMLKFLESEKEFLLNMSVFEYNQKYYLVQKERFEEKGQQEQSENNQNLEQDQQQVHYKFFQVIQIIPNKNTQKANDLLFLTSIYTQYSSTLAIDTKSNDQKFLIDQMKQIGKNFINFAHIHSLSFDNQFKEQDMHFKKIYSMKLEPNPQTSSNQNSKILTQTNQENQSVSSFVDSDEEDQGQQVQSMNTSKMFDLNQSMDKSASKANLNQKLKKESNFKSKPKYQIEDLILKDWLAVPEERIITLIKQNKQHQKCYLKHKFIQNVQKIQTDRYEYDPKNQPITDDYVFQNGRYQMNQKKDIYFADKEAIKVQKQILVQVIKKAGKALLSGQSVMNMPVPVELSQPRSMTQRIALSVCLFPKYVSRALATNNQIQQLKIVTQMVAAFPIMFVNVEKAFNPILGETLEVKIGGLPFYFEQISHHPPITSMFSKNSGYEYYGNFESHLSIGMNNAVGKLISLITLKLKNTNSQYVLKLFDIQVGGLIYGDRVIRPYNKIYVYEKNKGLYSEVTIGKKFSKGKPYVNNKSQIDDNELNGGFYKVNDKFLQKFNKTKLLKFQGITKDDIVQEYGKLHGKWYDQIYVDDKKVRSMYSPLPNKLQFLPVVLPSDSNLRPDLLYFKMKMNKASNKQKQVMQNIQRRDKKLRLGKIKPGSKN